MSQQFTTFEEVHASLRDHPEQWEAFNRSWARHGASNGDFKDYRVYHQNGTEVWIANGLGFVEIKGVEKNLSFVKKVRLWHQIKKAKKKMLKLEQYVAEQKIHQMNQQLSQQQSASYQLSR